MRLDWLGTPALSWRDLLVISKQSPRTSALARALLGDDASWGIAEHLAAGQIDMLRVLAWMQSADGAKGVNRPKPLERPGMKSDADSKIGRTALPLDEVAARMAARNPAQHGAQNPDQE